MYRSWILMLAACLLCAASPGCSTGAKDKEAAAIEKVKVCKPEKGEVTENVDYTGRTNAVNAVVIQARVTGILEQPEKPLFTEGDIVAKNQPLFIIDPRPYQALVDAAQAQLDQGIAGKSYADATYQQYKLLHDNKKSEGAVSEKELNQYKALAEQGKANVELAQANLRTAKLNLDWTTVRSPIAGKVSRYYVTPGNLINQDSTQLTSVVSMDPMYVYFDMDESTMLRIKRSIAAGKISADIEGSLDKKAPVFMQVQGEEPKLRAGVVDFLDNQVNPATGSIAVRGVFPNPKLTTYALVPGMFVRVRLPIGQPRQALLVNDKYVKLDQGGKFVYVLNSDNLVKQKYITAGWLEPNGLRVIEPDGKLKEDDWVVIGALPKEMGKAVNKEIVDKMPFRKDN